MFQNFIKVAIRNLTKHMVFSVINILGLAFGLMCTILIALWVSDERKYDQFHEKGHRIYQTIAAIDFSGEPQYWTNSPGPLAPALHDDISGVEAAIRVSHTMTPLMSKNDLRFKPSGIYADSIFLQVFSFPLQYGDKSTALMNPYSIIISNELSHKFFQGENPIGKTLTVRDYGENVEYTVTGVLEKIPSQSTLQFDFVMPYGPYHKKRSWMHQWGNYDDITFVLLSQDAHFARVDKNIRDFISKRQDNNSTTQLHLFPFADLYLKSDFSRGLGEGGKIVYVRLLMVIAGIILLIACINFMNLSTARAGKRAKEVGVRKATGASRSSLIFQFLGESVFLTLISTLLAITLADLALPAFNILTVKAIQMPYTSPGFMGSLLGLAVIVGLLAGSYPAVSLSAFEPAKVLKGAAHSGKSLAGLRKVLVVFQFTLSIVLIISTVVVYTQIQYVLNKDLGIAKHNILDHRLYGAAKQHEVYRNELLKIDGVKAVAYSNFNPLSIGNTTGSVEWSGKFPEAQTSFHVIQTDDNFIETFGLKLLEGENFPAKADTAMAYFIINKEAARVMGMNDPVGNEISVWGQKGRIYGVVNDFHHQNLFAEIEPIVVYYNPSAVYRSFIALDGNDINKTLVSIESLFKEYDQQYPFEYSFIDEDYAANYDSVVTTGSLANIFAIMAIMISCLGLFGLASYMTEQRRKETGIRKVFGASVLQLTSSFSADFLKLVMISFVLSVPIAWYVTDHWLSNFSYSIEMSYAPFIIAGICAVVIALLTVSYHTVRAAMANPVNSLKYE